MMKIINRFILLFVPYLPKFLVYLIAGKYVAGETQEAALSVVKDLNDKGFSVTIDILGEHVRDEDKAAYVTRDYVSLYEAIDQNHLDCSISLKPTHIGMELSEDIFRRNLDILLQKAKECNNFLRIDMENSPYTDRTIQAYQHCFSKYMQVGTVFQAYLFRTEADVSSLFGDGFNFRLCKGIYRESPEIAIQDRHAINRNYLKILEKAFTRKAYVGIATHDLELLQDVYDLIEKLHIPSSRFEFQVLYGVPMSGWLEKHLERDYKVRIYVPYGPEWYDYSVRRLKENPDITGYVMGNLFRKT